MFKIKNKLDYYEKIRMLHNVYIKLIANFFFKKKT